MHNFEQTLREYINNELVVYLKSKFSDHMLITHLRLIEGDVAKTYTTKIFKEVKEKIMKVGH